MDLKILSHNTCFYSTNVLVQAAVKILNQEVTAVDMLQINRSSLLLEVNRLTGLKDVETDTGKVTAKSLLRFVEKRK